MTNGQGSKVGAILLSSRRERQIQKKEEDKISSNILQKWFLKFSSQFSAGYSLYWISVLLSLTLFAVVKSTFFIFQLFSHSRDFQSLLMKNEIHIFYPIVTFSSAKVNLIWISQLHFFLYSNTLLVHIPTISGKGKPSKKKSLTFVKTPPDPLNN